MWESQFIWGWKHLFRQLWAGRWWRWRGEFVALDLLNTSCAWRTLCFFWPRKGSRTQWPQQVPFPKEFRSCQAQLASRGWWRPSGAQLNPVLTSEAAGEKQESDFLFHWGEVAGRERCCEGQCFQSRFLLCCFPVMTLPAVWLHGI